MDRPVAAKTGSSSDNKSAQFVGFTPQVVTADKVIIATGSKARHLPNVPVDNVIVADNEGALKFAEVPKKLGVIGAGVIGLELGSVWRRLGSEVTILEALPSFLGAADESVAKEANKLLTKQGLKINVGVKVGEIESSAKGVKVNYTDAAGAAQVLECDKLIVSIGRVPNTDGLGLEAIGLATDQRGFIEVDDHCATKLPNLWAIGDVTGIWPLTHVGKYQGRIVAANILGEPRFTYITRDVPAPIRAAYQKAVAEALMRCMPLSFTEGLSGAIAGRIFSWRIHDTRPNRKA